MLLETLAQTKSAIEPAIENPAKASANSCHARHNASKS